MGNQQKYGYLVGLFFLLISLASAASADKGSFTSVSAANSSDITEITWSYWGNPWEVAINQRIIAVFESEHPNIKVRPIHYPWSDYFDKANLWLQSNNPPDVLFLSHIHHFITKRNLLKLNDFIRRDNYDIDDFYPLLLSLFKRGEDIYGFPRDNDTKVIFYNKQHFDEAQLPYPKCTWNWQDFYRTAKQLNKPHLDRQAFAYEFFWLQLLFKQNGVELDLNSDTPESAILEGDQARQTLEWFIDTIQVVGSDKVGTSSYDVTKRFVEGKTSMAFGNHALVPEFVSRASFLWDVTCLPQGIKRVNHMGGAGYVISKKSKNKEAAWKFLKWLSSKQGQAIFTESGSIVPSRISVSHSRVFSQLRGEQHAKVFIEETLHGKPEYYYPKKHTIELILVRNIKEVIHGNLDLTAALKQARSDITMIRNSTQGQTY